MHAYNRVSSRVFDLLLAPFGHRFAGFDLLVWPVVMGVVALLVYKVASNQEAIARVKNQIGTHLLEIRLFSHDIARVLSATGSIVVRNLVYVGHNALPMVVMLVPMLAIMVQLVAHYAYAPSPVGSVELLRMSLDPEAAVSARDVSLELPEGVILDAPAVRTADGRVFWRLRAEGEGDHVLAVDVAGQRFPKSWAVGGGPRKVPRKRVRGWEALLYPGEEAIPASAPVLSLELDGHTRELGFFPDGELGILLWSLGLSLVAGFALRGLFGVTF